MFSFKNILFLWLVFDQLNILILSIKRQFSVLHLHFVSVRMTLFYHRVILLPRMFECKFQSMRSGD